MRAIFAVGLLVLGGCTKQVQVSAIQAGSDYNGLSDYERGQFDWAAIDVTIPASVARDFRRAQSSNVTLDLFRCDAPADAYPAYATMGGKLFDYDNFKEPLNDTVTLTFYLPRHVQQREQYGCAALDARGYSVVFFRSHTLRLPKLSFVRFRETKTAPKL